MRLLLPLFWLFLLGQVFIESQERLELEGILKINLCHVQQFLPADQAAQGPIQLFVPFLIILVLLVFAGADSQPPNMHTFNCF